MLTITGLKYFTMKSFTTSGKGEDVICWNEIVYYLSGIAKFLPRAILDLGVCDLGHHEVIQIKYYLRQ